MSIEKIKQKLEQTSIKDTTWLEEFKFRYENKDLLDLLFEIELKIGSILNQNNKTNTFPKNYIELADAIGFTHHQLNNLLKGKENIEINTICKIEKILNTKLIEVVK